MSARKPSLLLLAATIMAVSLPALADHDDYDDDDYHHHRYSQEHRARAAAISPAAIGRPAIFRAPALPTSPPATPAPA